MKKARGLNTIFQLSALSFLLGYSTISIAGSVSVCTGNNTAIGETSGGTQTSSNCRGELGVGLYEDFTSVFTGENRAALGVGLNGTGDDPGKILIYAPNGTTISSSLNMSNSNINNVATGVADTDAVNVGQLNTVSQEKVDAAVETANNYTNSQVEIAESNANAYTDTKAQETLDNAYAYADVLFQSSNSGAGYDQLSNSLNRLDRDLRELKSEMQEGLAMSAAMAGLFQPYSVGKFNATVAMGGYGSKGAVAVGSGYRFTENVAVKAGVATIANNGKASYNVGMNFEW